MSAVRFPSALFLYVLDLWSWEGESGTFGIWDTTRDDCCALTSTDTVQSQYAGSECSKITHHASEEESVGS